MSAVTEDGLNVILSRVERLGADLDRAKRAERQLEKSNLELAHTRRLAEDDYRRKSADLRAAEAKICEWAEYASQLRAAINAIDPRAIKRKKIVLPDMPKPLETEIPF